MENRHADFAELASKAQQRLMDETFPIDTSDAQCVLLLSVQPAFGNFVSWTVFSRVKRIDFLIQKTVWDKAFDQARFFYPLEGLKYGWHTTPTITTRVATLPQAVLDKLLVEGRTIHIKPENRRGIVLDGVAWFLKLRGAFQDRLLSWNALPGT